MWWVRIVWVVILTSLGGVWMAGCSPAIPTAPTLMPTDTEPVVVPTVPASERPDVVPTSLSTRPPSPSPGPSLSQTPTPRLTPTLPVPSPSPTAIQTGPGFVLPAPRVQELTWLQVQPVNARQGWALARVGPYVYVLRTEDGGFTWRNVSPPWAGDSGEWATALFWDANTAWVTYAVWDPARVPDLAVVWSTTDGGLTWQAAPLPLTVEEPRFEPGPLVSSDGRSLWLLAHVEGGMQKDFSVLLTSQDAGRTWQRIADPYRETAYDLMTLYTNDLAFLSQGYGWATKDNGVAPGGVLVITEDGGRTWQAMVLDPPQAPEEDFFSCDTRSPHLWSPGQGSVLLTCPYAGEPVAYLVLWERGEAVYLPLPIVAEGMRFFSPQEGFVWGPDLAGNTWLYRTQDAGLSWQEVTVFPRPMKFAFSLPSLGWAWSLEGDVFDLWLTQNGGVTWDRRTPQIRGPSE